MNLYLLTQEENYINGNYDSCVVVASTQETAKLINPSCEEWGSEYSSWASSPSEVTATLIGKAEDDLELNSIIISSYNGG